MTTLDIRDWKENGQDLKIAITIAVSEYSRSLTQTLPDELIMTKEQYKMLQPDPDIDIKDRLYYTPLNCMEIRVK